MKTQTFLLLLGGLASLALADSDCQTIINCKSTATVTSTVIPPASTVTVTNTITLTPSCSPTACPTLSCPPCPSVTTPGTTSGTPAPAAPTCTTTVQDWKRADVKWTSEHPKPGAPAPAMFSSNFNYETILTLTDDSTSLERFEVYQDYKFLGKTSEATAATKGKIIHNAVEAIKLGYSHASFNIPAGPHTFMVTWQDAANNPETKEWTSGAFQYRFQRVEPYQAPSYPEIPELPQIDAPPSEPYLMGRASRRSEPHRQPLYFLESLSAWLRRPDTIDEHERPE
ncbi:hypothetical protein CFD26_100169 [Aspergillus turcosus]|uniref:Uncharacterized protein n=1 Tax=Aspergillus turcosus TaxID=1245748 RepID=A0A3R7F1P9_9EURO|nr:hypothetical protein CFD26_100169 [Aspergillus turcosus]